MIAKKQFIICREELQLEQYQCIPLQNGRKLYYHNQLSVFYLEKSDAVLLGEAWQVMPDRKSPEEELRLLSERISGYIDRKEILNMEMSWCGRYVLIVQGTVYMDTAGLLGVFYSDFGISSSEMLLAEQMKLELRLYEPVGKANYCPGPLTPYQKIRRLLPGQIYHLDSGKAEYRPLKAEIEAMPSEKKRIQKFTDLFAESLKNMVQKYPECEVSIALTGGHDSRTLLALAHYAKIPFSTLTFEHDEMGEDDRRIPEQLSKMLHCRHSYIPRNREKFREERLEEYRRFVGGLVADADRWYYAYDQFEDFRKLQGKKTLLLRSSVWEVSADYYKSYLEREPGSEGIYCILEAPRNTFLRKTVDEYVEWCRKYPQRKLPFWDQYYWEQRCGSWLSSIEQGFDLLDDMISLQPMNCRLLLSMLLEFPEDEKQSKKHQDKIIACACPEIAEVPFGKDWSPSRSKYEKILVKYRQFRTFWKLVGFRYAVEVYSKKLRKKLKQKD